MDEQKGRFRKKEEEDEEEEEEVEEEIVWRREGGKVEVDLMKEHTSETFFPLEVRETAAPLRCLSSH